MYAPIYIEHGNLKNQFVTVNHSAPFAEDKPVIAQTVLVKI